MRRNLHLEFASAIFIATATLAWPCASRSLTVEDQPEFREINAIEAAEDGSFVMVGRLQTEPLTYKSGLLHISAKGAALGPVVELPSPGGDYTGVVTKDLALLPGGDVIVGGWAAKENGHPDAWLSRITKNGGVVWSKPLPAGELQRFIYRIKRLSTGKLIAVGQSQRGNAKTEPARGLAIWFDAQDGPGSNGETKISTPPCPGNARRCAFRDVAELPDGRLVFAGWTTRNGKDDIWVLKTGADGKPVNGADDKPVTAIYGAAGNDIANAVAMLEGTVLVVGTGRDNTGKRLVSLKAFDLDLAERKPVTLSETDLGRGRSVLPLPSVKRFLIAGEISDGDASNGFVASLPSGGETADVTGMTTSGAAKRYYDIAVNTDGVVALAGFAKSEATTQGVYSLYPEKGFAEKRSCAPDETITPLSLDATPRAACAVAGTPKRFKVANANPDSAIVVRSVEGDADAVLLRDGAVLASSLNRGEKAPELLIVPAEQDNLELQVAASTPEAHFKIELAKLAPPESSAERKVNEADAKLDAFALRTLGYAVHGDPIKLVGYVERFDRQAVLAFQLAGGFPLTGVLTVEARARLHHKTALRIDVLAGKAAEAGRAAAASDSASKTHPTEFETVTAIVAPDGHYGIWKMEHGEFGGRFRGEADDPTPVLGVWTITDTCSFTFGIADGFKPSSFVSEPAFGTFGVFRENGNTWAGHANGQRPAEGCGPAG